MRRLHCAGLVLLFAAAARAQAGVQDDPRFVRGRELFARAFHRADGLGSPDFNGDSCRACHRDPVLGGAGALELNVSRFANDNNGQGPFQNVPGGQTLSKLRPPWAAGREEHTIAATVFEQRQTPSILGDGLIDTIPAVVITANEDPLDADGDGVRGIARRLDIAGTIEIGRFGWKAQIPRLADFVRDAMFGELGLTTHDDGRGFATATDGDAKPDPEFTADQASDVAFFLAGLPAPQRGGSLDAEVTRGAEVFSAVGCAKCHRPHLQGALGPVPLFSDLLLHNVMAPGFRGMAEPGADVGFYRTPPLWGIRDTAPYMHDGRAEDLAAAVAHHDGEALLVRQAYEQSSAADRAALIRFLQDL